MTENKLLKKDKETAQKIVLQILEYHREEYPFEDGEVSTERYQHQWLSKFLNEYLKTKI